MDPYGRDLPPTFRRHMIDVFGEAGERWLSGLPALLEDCERRWNLRLEAPFALSYSYVAPAIMGDDARIVVKAGVPNEELRWQIDAVRAFQGAAVVRLIDADADSGLALLERIDPGTMLLDLVDDDEATVIAAGVMLALWRPAPLEFTFPTVKTWAREAFDTLRERHAGGVGPFSPSLVGRAEATLRSEVPVERATLLHGDVHHENILLDDRRGWLAIDPQGVIGEPAYEAGTFLRNHLMRRPDAARVLARRVDILVDRLSMEREMIIEWALAHNVMSACWSESHGGAWQEAIAVAELLAALARAR